MPVIGMEAEFNVFWTGRDRPAYWGRPLSFIDTLLPREKSCSSFRPGRRLLRPRRDPGSPVIEWRAAPPPA
jgi:hypothetical protein